MSSLAALAGDHLASLGLSTSLLGSVTDSLQLHDILSIALRMALVGLFVAAVRAIFYKLRVVLTDYIFPSAHISSSDPAFNWIMAYLAQDDAVQNQLKSFRLTTADTRESKRHDAYRNSSQKQVQNNLLVSKAQASFQMDNVVGQTVPVNERSVFVKYQGGWLWVKRSESGFAMTNSNAVNDHLCITGLFFQPDSIKRFLVAAHDLYFKKADSEILIFHPSPMTGHWYDPLSRPARTWKSVILPGTIKEEILEDVKDFLSEEQKEWYAARGIPHRRGYLLHGRPGAGKTTLATAVASELKLDIYVINPAARGMDDGKLNKAFRVCPPGNMILIEDIDCVMPPRKSTGKDGEEEEDDGDSSPAGTAAAAEGDPGKFGYAKSTVTLSGLLNAIDGVSSQEDCVLFASTNHPNRLDEALSRPGRFDVHVAFNDALHGQAIALFKHFYPTIPSSDQLNEKRPTDTIEELAQHFADGVFGTEKLCDGTEVAVSMAALQGYLLKHKKSPTAAAQHAREWAEEIRVVQEERALKKQERIRLREERAQLDHALLEQTQAAAEGVEKEEAKGEVVQQGPPTPTSPGFSHPLPL